MYHHAMKNQIIFFLVLIFFAMGCSNLSSTDKNTIAKAISLGPPELIQGASGIADSSGTKIWYEVLEPKDKVRGTILLVMGIGQSALVWPNYFTQPIVDAGYRVIRFDHRDVGMSDISTKWNKENAYTLKNMSADAMAILDTLEISKAHILGVSMGGFIAQEIAKDYSHRVLTLTSIMSAQQNADGNFPEISMALYVKIFWAFIRYRRQDNETAAIKLELAMLDIINGKSPQHRDTKQVAERVLYEMRFRRGIDTSAIRKHSIAIAKMENPLSNSLNNSTIDDMAPGIPTLIVHGKLDPVIPFASGQQHAESITAAKTLWIDDMGHDIAPAHAKLIHVELFSLLASHPGDISKENLSPSLEEK